MTLSGWIRRRTRDDDEWSLITRGRVLDDAEMTLPREGIPLPEVTVDLSTRVVDRPVVDLGPILKQAAAALIAAD